MDVLLHAPRLSRLEALEHARSAYGIEGDGGMRALVIRPPMPFTRENAADLAATLDEVLGR